MYKFYALVSLAVCFVLSDVAVAQTRRLTVAQAMGKTPSLTSWELYDTHYTERWMDTPEDNAGGYRAALVLTYVTQYKGGRRCWPVCYGDDF